MRLVRLLAALAVVGCSQPAEPAPGPAARPATLDRSTFVEGEPYVEVLELAEVDALPIPFSVYLRPGVRVTRPADGEAVEFAAGAPAMQATVRVQTVDESPAAAAARVRAAYEAPIPLDGADWAAESFAFQDGGESGSVYIAQHAGTTFVVSARAPHDMGDGFAPTLQTLLDTWQWGDGSALR